MTVPQNRPTRRALLALDIGSTVVKFARLDAEGNLLGQQFFPRDYKAGVATQVRSLLAQLQIDPATEPILVCSSANGGLRVGIVALSPLFSGTALRNQVLLAGANPEYLHTFGHLDGDMRHVDILLVGGGIDEADSGPAAQLLELFEASRYSYSAIVYCGNKYLAERFKSKFQQARIIDNPLGDQLSSRVGSVFETVRRAYLDDLVFKEGITDLPTPLNQAIRPTPEVASRGFLRSVNGQGGFSIVGTCIALDIGGATTDLHYTVELVDDDSVVRPATGVSVARYVFTDLGIFASRDTLMLQLRNHPQLYELLVAAMPDTSVLEVRDFYANLREGELNPDPEILAYSCLFMALDRFAQAKGPGLPKADLGKLAQLILTGGAAQTLDESVVARVLALLLPAGACAPLIQVDRQYAIWVAGITWDERPVAHAF